MLLGGIFHFYLNSNRTLFKQTVDICTLVRRRVLRFHLQETCFPGRVGRHSVASDLGLHFLTMSLKTDATR